MRRLTSAAWSAVRAHPVIASAAVAVVLVVVLPVANYLISPLWTRTALHEASPLDVAAAASAPPAATSTSAAPAPASSVASTASATPASSTPAAASPAATAAPPKTSSPTAAAGTSTPAGTPSAAGPQVVARGMFKGADDFHFGRGDALLIEVAPQRYTLRFENFSVQNGPDLFVYLSDDAGGYGGTVLKLGGLRATDGAFNYDVPAGTDVTKFRSAIVWCDRFSQLFATAAFR